MLQYTLLKGETMKSLNQERRVNQPNSKSEKSIKSDDSFNPNIYYIGPIVATDGVC